MNDSIFIKTALHYGALSGIGTFIFNLLLYVSGINLFGTAAMAGIWIPVLFLYLSIKFHRNSNLGGAISFKQAFIMGLSVSLFSATLFGLAFYLFGTIYDPGILELYKIQAAASLEEGKAILSEYMYEKAMESIDLVTISSLSFSEAFNKIIGGALVSLVMAGILKKKADTGQQEWM